MYCKKCGAKLEDGAKFCSQCGTVVNNTSETKANAKENPYSLNMNIISWVLIVLLALMFLGSLPSISSIIFLFCIVIMLPINQFARFFPKFYLRVLISVVLAFVAILIYPTCDHEYTVIENTAPTCTEEGRIVQQCSLCERKNTERQKALGHEYAEVSRKEPTASSDGEVVQKCTRCGDVVKTVLDKIEVETTAAPLPEDEYLVRSVDELVSELNSNAYQAKEFYDGKKVEITGRVWNIDASGKYISLCPDDITNYYTVQCFLDTFDKEQKDWLAKFAVDDVITLRGTITAVGEIIGYQFDIDSFIKVNASESVAKFNEESVKKQLEVATYSLNTKYSHYAFLTIKNNSEFTISITANVKFFDESGALIGAKNDSQHAVAGGSETVIVLYPDDTFAKMEYEIEVSEDTWYKSAVPYLSYESTPAKGKEILAVTNNGSTAARSVTAYALFFNGDQIVNYTMQYFTDSDFELKPGKTITEEMDCSAEYTSVKFFFNGYN